MSSSSSSSMSSPALPCEPLTSSRSSQASSSSLSHSSSSSSSSPSPAWPAFALVFFFSCLLRSTFSRCSFLRSSFSLRLFSHFSSSSFSSPLVFVTNSFHITRPSQTPSSTLRKRRRGPSSTNLTALFSTPEPCSKSFFLSFSPFCCFCCSRLLKTRCVVVCPC